MADVGERVGVAGVAGVINGGDADTVVGGGGTAVGDAPVAGEDVAVDPPLQATVITANRPTVMATTGLKAGMF